MYEIKELEDTFDWSYDQIRDRVLRLNDKVGGVVSRGQKNKILISEKGLSLLRKLSDLESSGKAIQSSIKTISQDLGNSQSQEKVGDSKEYKEQSKTVQSSVVEVLKDRVQELQQDKRRLQDKVDTLEQRLITGEVQEKNEKEELREKLHEKELEAERMRVQLEKREKEEGDKNDFKELGLIQVVKKWFTTKT